MIFTAPLSHWRLAGKQEPNQTDKSVLSIHPKLSTFDANRDIYLTNLCLFTVFVNSV